ncbi:MAG: hypothetical protein HQL21_05420 [Candidatus Omnitrophica bacterium]|nr:hypothetical protein [Candidatus Omnitrophota bacterium]
MRKLYTSALVFIFLFFGNAAFADLTLSVSPADGSSSLRFDRIIQGQDNRKEIRVRVTSTGGNRYQVFQRIQDPIVNGKGEGLNFQALQSVTMNNSNAAGTLYLQNADRMNQADQLLYTSSQNGDSDSFLISYVVDPANMGATGRFFGKILFTVRSMSDSSQEQAFVNISLESISNWKASVSGGRTPGQIRIKDSDVAETSADFVKISFSGNVGEEIRIYQEFNDLPQSATAEEIMADALRFLVAGETEQNVRISGAVPVKRARTLIYAGKSPEDSLKVYFLVNPDKIQEANAGTYKGKIKYIIETNKGPEDFLIDLECDIQPVFNLDVTLPAEGVSFTNVLATNPPTEREVMVTVHSNLHRAYQVLQDLQAPMANEKGNEIEKGYFTAKVEVLSGEKGQSRFTDFSSINTGEYPVFSSDSKGSPATFKVIYRLQGYPQLMGGNYSAPIRFSLNQN